MKAIFIVYNQTITEKVEYMFEKLNIRGYTKFPIVMGTGTSDGEPRLGTHTWPEMNSATLTVVSDEMVDIVLEKIRKLDDLHHEIGIRAFVWNIEKSV